MVKANPRVTHPEVGRPPTVTGARRGRSTVRQAPDGEGALNSKQRLDAAAAEAEAAARIAQAEARAQQEAAAAAAALRARHETEMGALRKELAAVQAKERQQTESLAAAQQQQQQAQIALQALQQQVSSGGADEATRSALQAGDRAA